MQIIDHENNTPHYIISCIGLFFLMILSFYSCHGLELGSDPSGLMTKTEIHTDSDIISNPYEINNMQNALNIVKNMALDYNQQHEYTAGLDISEFTIEPNYRYVKFMPSSLEQEAELKSCADLVLVDYPLSYQNADHYYLVNNIDPPEAEALISYYTSTPLNTTYPLVPFEELQLMYLPDEDIYFNDVNEESEPTIVGRISNKYDFINHLYTVAYDISDNRNLIPPDRIEADENGMPTKFLGISFRSKWNPWGTITIWDENVGTTTYTEQYIIGYQTFPCPDDGFNESVDFLDANGDPMSDGSGSSKPDELELEMVNNNRVCRRPIYGTRVTGTEVGSYVPLQGAQVLVRDTFTLGNAITDSNGNFRFSGKRPAVRYILQWERYKYSIRDNGWQAELRGPKRRKKPWIKKIRGGEPAYHANIHRGAHMYYYANLPGLMGPPEPSFAWFGQMKIAASDHSGASSHVPFRGFWGLSTIRIKKHDASTEQQIGVTIHELAHAVHWKKDIGAYTNLVHDAYIPPFSAGGERDDNKRLLESWATHIEITYMDEFYRRLGEDASYKYRRFNLQNQLISDPYRPSLNYYTTLIYDLTDDTNQRLDFGILRPVDNVEGFSLKQVEDALLNATDLDDYKSSLFSLNVDTNSDIVELFNNW